MKRLFLDLETYCEEPITSGAHKYAESAEILLFSYAIDAAPAKVWDLTADKKMPSDLRAAIKDRDTLFIAHNSAFDRTVLKRFSKRFEDVNNWRDTMVRAYAHGLPGSLAVLCGLYNLGQEKSKASNGHRLIHLFCKPRPKNNKLKRATRFSHPNEWKDFVDYARLDVVSMRELYYKLPRRNHTKQELVIWRLDQGINDRGFFIDTELVESALKMVDVEQKHLRKMTKEKTQGALESTTQRDAFLAHILEVYKVELPDAKAVTIQKRIDDPSLPNGMKELLRLRLSATTSSTAKYKKLSKCVSSDGRLRGTLQFDGAARTRRWAGRLFQPHNLPRPSFSSEEVERGIAALKAGCADLIYDNVMAVTSSALRGCVAASKGRKLVVSDLSNIEGRIQAWIAGEEWKLQAFRAFDNGRGHDLYKLAYAKMFRVNPEDITKNQRQIGKTSELAGGYGGGVGAFVTFATSFNIDLDLLAEEAYPLMPSRILTEAEGMWEWAKARERTLGIAKKTFIVMDSFKRQWREAHPAISSYWQIIEGAVRNAISRKNTVFSVKGMKVESQGAWLYILMPSGRSLCYPNPRIDEDGQILFKGMDPYTRKWGQLGTYGGKIFENLCQSLARDVLADNMCLVQDAGYDIVLTVHDEVICDTPDSDEFNPVHLSGLLSHVPDWAEGLPLAAAGFEGCRYRKD